MKILEIAHVDFALYQFLLPVMRRLKQRGHEVVGVCAEGPLLDPVRTEGFRICTVPFVRSFSIVGQAKAFWALYGLIRREKPDIVHAHMPISGFLARLAAFLSGTPVIIYTCHGYLFNQKGQGIRSWVRRGLSLILEWLAGQVTHHYMTVSQEEANDAKRLRIHSRPVFIGNGRDPKRFCPDAAFKRRFREQHHIRPDRIIFLIVSRLVRHKGYPELLAAFTEMATRNDQAELWVVGERLASDYGQSMEVAFIETQKQMGDRLRLWGYRQDIDQLMKASDVFVLPSHFEGLPVSIVEAMLTGLPVISTRIRGPREQVDNGVTGLLVPPGQIRPLADALLWMADHPAERQAMGRHGREKAVSLYSETAHLDRIMTVFSKVEKRALHHQDSGN